MTASGLSRLALVAAFALGLGPIFGCAASRPSVEDAPAIVTTKDDWSDVAPVMFSAAETGTPASEPADDGPLELSVEQAVVLALRNNRDLRVQQLEPVIAGTFERIERGAFDPEIFAEATYFEEEASETSRSTGERFDVSANETEAAVGIRQLLPTGTTLEAIASGNRSESNRTPQQQSARVGLSVTQSLLRGFGPAVNLVELRQAAYDRQASLQELRGFTEALLADTEIAYWNYILAREEIAIFEESLAVVRKQLQEIELRIEVGILPEIEAAAARAEEALRVQALIEAQSQLEDRRLRLLNQVNAGPASHPDRRILTTSEFRTVPHPVDDREDRLRLALKSRPDLNEARIRLQQDRLETVRTRNGLLPRLDLFIAFGKTGYADTFSDAYRELNGDTYDMTAGIRLSHTLGRRSARAQDVAARASRQQSAEAVANLEQLVRLDVLLAINEVERARKQIDASRASRIFQEQSLNAEKERFDVGTSTALLLAQAHRDLLSTQISEIESIVNYRIALIRLYLAEGSLLDRRGVRIASN